MSFAISVAGVTAGNYATSFRPIKEVSLEEEEIQWAREAMVGEYPLSLAAIVEISGRSREYWVEKLGLKKTYAYDRRNTQQAEKANQRVDKTHVLYLLKFHTQAEVARIVGVSRNRIHQIKHGRHK